MPSEVSENIVLISGANTGIGLATARILAANPSYTIIIGSRSLDNGLEAKSSLAKESLSVTAIQLDITSDASIAAAKQHIETLYGRLDVLVNNAGVFPELTSESFSLPIRDLFTQTFEVNVIGTASLTDAMLPLLRKASHPRIVFVSSKFGSLANALDPTAGFHDTNYMAYRASKAAMNMLAVRFGVMLTAFGGSVNAVCPGLVNTKLVNNHPAGSTPEIGAGIIVEMVMAKKGSIHGSYTDNNGVIDW